MTLGDHHLPFEAYLDITQQAINDFDRADGLEVQVRLNRNPDYLELLAETTSGERHAFGYRATKEDLRDYGSSWFIRRALRSLNDRFLGGNLPQASGEAEFEFLRPPDAYPAGD